MPVKSCLDVVGELLDPDRRPRRMAIRAGLLFPALTDDV